MEKLIKITANENGDSVVSARDLHFYFENTDNVNTWFSRQSEMAMLEEGVDYVRFAILQPSGQTAYDYAITLSSAKEMSMLNGGNKGKQARKYFIECERLIKENIIKPRTHLEVLDSEREVWRPVIGYECNYEASSIGRIRSIDRVVITNKKRHCKSTILKPRLGKQGYFYVSLYLNGKAKTFNVHQIVAISFLNHIPCGYGLVVNHKNFDKKDNRVDNLELITNRANSLKLNIKSSSIYTGVSFCKTRKLWKSQVYINGKTINIGYFNCETKAHLNYLLALKSV